MRDALRLGGGCVTNLRPYNLIYTSAYIYCIGSWGKELCTILKLAFNLIWDIINLG